MRSEGNWNRYCFRCRNCKGSRYFVSKDWPKMPRNSRSVIVTFKNKKKALYRLQTKTIPQIIILSPFLGWIKEAYWVWEGCCWSIGGKPGLPHRFRFAAAEEKSGRNWGPCENPFHHSASCCISGTYRWVWVYDMLQPTAWNGLHLHRVRRHFVRAMHSDLQKNPCGIWHSGTIELSSVQDWVCGLAEPDLQPKDGKTDPEDAMRELWLWDGRREFHGPDKNNELNLCKMN